MTTPGGPRPRTGDDTDDLIDDTLAELAERRDASPGNDLTAITLITSLIDQAERFLPERVTSARLNGTPGTRLPAPWAPAPTRPACGSTPNPRSPTRDGPTTSSRRTCCGADDASLAAVNLPELYLPQVALELAPAHHLVDAPVRLAERRDRQLDRAVQHLRGKCQCRSVPPSDVTPGAMKFISP